MGALTSKDFRFKARVWFLRSAKTICTGCATGCNAFLDYDPRSQTPYRHRPRENAAVNQFWMCDEGMLSYRRLSEGRLVEPRVGGRAASVEAALARVKGLMQSAGKGAIAILLSEEHSSEDNIALLELGRSHLGTADVFVTGRPRGAGDSVLKNEDKNPNRLGVRRLAPQARSLAELIAGIQAGTFRVVFALGSAATDAAAWLELFAGRAAAPAALVTLASHEGPLVQTAAVALPVCAWAEAEGTYVNARGLAQVSERALEARGDARPAWQTIGRIGEALGYATAWRKLAQIRALLNPLPSQDAMAANL